MNYWTTSKDEIGSWRIILPPADMDAAERVLEFLREQESLFHIQAFKHTYVQSTIQDLALKWTEDGKWRGQTPITVR